MYIDLPDVDLSLTKEELCEECWGHYGTHTKLPKVRGKKQEYAHCTKCVRGYNTVVTDFGRDLLKFLDNYYVRS